MTEHETTGAAAAEPRNDEDGGGAGRELPDAARRALAEAAARRAAPRGDAQPPKELNGRSGPDPVRYGDWEVKGIASDF